ncbi:Protein of unknown function [Gryllus bimaculatus]|nr:Protein of unknown function [Gryllus bimaculatus]
MRFRGHCASRPLDQTGVRVDRHHWVDCFAAATAMRTFLLLQLAILAVTDGTKGIQVRPVKCCGKFRMLSGDGKSCVDTDWPQNVSHPFHGESYTLQPIDLNWMRRWLPPGVPLQSIRKVYYNKEYYVNTLPNIVKVNSSSVWDAAHPPRENIWKSQLVFSDQTAILRPRPGGGVREAISSCVDAAMPPLGPYALLFGTVCTDNECATKCCRRGETLVKVDETWVCKRDDENFWDPFNSSFAKEIDAEFPIRVYMRCPDLRLTDSAKRSLDFALSLKSQFTFSTRRPCVDFYRKNTTVQEGVFYCEDMRIARGVYWLLRPLCITSVLLLLVSLASIACDKSMRSKVHGRCLAHHAACLLAFNVGQVVYYVALSNTIDSNQEVPKDLKKMCTHFGIKLYLYEEANNCSLHKKNNNRNKFELQVFRTSRSGRKRLVLFSAFSWGLPALLTIVYSYLFTPMEFGYLSSEDIPWHRPQLMEARVCYSETLIVTLDKDHKQQYISLRYGTAIFYYGPMGCLVLCNCMCLVLALTKMQKLRRGNSILRKDERRAPGHHHANENTRPPACTASPDGRTNKARNGGSSRTATDAKT